MNKTVFITGITGFLGSSIAAKLVATGYNVIGSRRKVSDISRCKLFENQIHWVFLDNEGWEKKIIDANPEIIIHAAWDGVTAVDRGDLHRQLANLDLIASLLEIARTVNAERCIFLGSQGEYGILNSPVGEEDSVQPVDAYGMAKNVAMTLVMHFCGLHRLNWYWLRVFSVFGENEKSTWLIPSIIQKIGQGDKQLAFTTASQQYAYLYIQDFVKAIIMVVERKEVPGSGVYNLSGVGAHTLREIITKTTEYYGQRDVTLNFGALPFRQFQSMHIEGKMDKFTKEIGEIHFSDFYQRLKQVVQHYKILYSTQ